MSLKYYLKMAKVIFLLAIVFIAFVGADAECETGWTAFKDELCIHASSDLFTYDEAQSYCASKSNGVTVASLVMVKESDLQDVLSNYTHDNFENLWLGGKYDNESAQFRWNDGELLSYTNWAEGYPRNITEAEVCIQLSPPNAMWTMESEGRWEDAICQRRNLALCQRQMPWSFQDAVREIMILRKQQQSTLLDLSITKEELRTTKDDLIATRQELAAVNARVVPVGSIYIEYFSQPSPPTLWPNLTWQDVTSTYAGLFFRALGGNSETWGKNQEECAPRLHQAGYLLTADPSGGSGLITLPTSGWSEYIWVGDQVRPFPPGTMHDRLRFNTQGCEVRPKNQAIRIWKRLA